MNGVLPSVPLTFLAPQFGILSTNADLIPVLQTSSL